MDELKSKLKGLLGGSKQAKGAFKGTGYKLGSAAPAQVGPANWSLLLLAGETVPVSMRPAARPPTPGCCAAAGWAVPPSTPPCGCGRPPAAPGRAATPASGAAAAAAGAPAAGAPAAGAPADGTLAAGAPADGTLAAGTPAGTPASAATATAAGPR